MAQLIDCELTDRVWNLPRQEAYMRKSWREQNEK
jgi:hypothetical protein